MQINQKVMHRQHEIFRLDRLPDTYEVLVESDITLADYQHITTGHEWELLEQLAQELRGQTVTFINPTMAGGGVAMMRPPIVHILQLLGVDAHWFVMNPEVHTEEVNPFLFTKQMHNILQRRTMPHEHITEHGKRVHQQWNRENAEVLMQQPAIHSADVIVLDDPQPAPLKPYIDEVNPGAKLVWRNHIDTDGEAMADPDTPQGQVADYIFKECGIGEVDAMITHPVEQFVHPDYRDKTYFAPATIEPFDDLNRHLEEREIEAGLEFVNAEIAAQNRTFEQVGRQSDVQSFIDPKRRRLTLLARFDESKGMDKALELGVAVREHLQSQGVAASELPQIILAGNGSVDDPSGIPMYEEMLQLRREHYWDAAEDIIIIRLRHNYMAMNALMYPWPENGNYDGRQLIGLQLSEAEGLETRISDWIRHGVPVVVSNRGGMQLQVIEGESGIVLDYDKPDWDIERGVEFISNLLRNASSYQSMRQSTLTAAQEFNDREFSTVANAIRLMRIFQRTQNAAAADRQWRVADMQI